MRRAQNQNEVTRRGGGAGGNQGTAHQGAAPRGWNGSGAGQPRPDHTRPYRILDVYSVEQGNLRLRLFISLMVLFVVVGAFLVLQEMMQFSIPDMDSNDLLRAFQDNGRRDQEIHLANFPPSGGMDATLSPSSGVESVTPSASVTVSLGTRTRSGGNIEDPRFRSIAPLPVSISGTAYTARFLGGSGRVDAPVPAGPLSMVEVAVRVAGSRVGARRVPLWRVTADWDSAGGALYAVRPLSGALCTVYLFEGSWKLLGVEPRYDGDPVHEGAGAPDSLPGSVLVAVEVHDAGEPVGPRLPSWTSFWRILVGLVLVVCTVFMSCALCCFQYIIRRNSRSNMGLPPPFFASWRQFRGW